MKLIIRKVIRICLRCKAEYEDMTGCMLCPDCLNRNKSLSEILGW